MGKIQRIRNKNVPQAHFNCHQNLGLLSILSLMLLQGIDINLTLTYQWLSQDQGALSMCTEGLRGDEVGGEAGHRSLEAWHMGVD